MYFAENKELFDKYLDKIIYIVADDYPITSNPWDREHYQRNCIDNGIKKLNLNNDDIIIISDVDEIPNFDTILKIKNEVLKINNDYIYSLEMKLYYYSLVWTTNRKWYHVKLLTYKKYIKISIPENIRMGSYNEIIKSGGWHISYYGTIHFIKNKLQSFSEQQDNNEKNNNELFLKECIENGKLFFNDEQLIYIPLENNNELPKSIKLIN